MADLDKLFSRENLEGLGKTFLEDTKARLKDHWDSYPDQVKEDIAATAQFASRIALEEATGTADALHAARKRHLYAQLSSIQVVGALEFRSLVDEALATAGRIAGSFFKQALVGALTGLKL